LTVWFGSGARVTKRRWESVSGVLEEHAPHTTHAQLSTHSSSAAPASRPSCSRAAARSICQYALPAWSTTGRGCLQVRSWVGGWGLDGMSYGVRGARVVWVRIAVFRGVDQALVPLQATTRMRLKPFLLRRWMRTAQSKQIERERARSAEICSCSICNCSRWQFFFPVRRALPCVARCPPSRPLRHCAQLRCTALALHAAQCTLYSHFMLVLMYRNAGVFAWPLPSP
jgi:hypothetical protein